MSGIYTVPFSFTGTDGTLDLVALVAHATKQCVLIGFEVGQSSDVGDAQEEIIQVKVRSGQTVAGSGGSAVTPTPTDPVGGVASGFTARMADTTQAGTGTIVDHYQYNWNIRQALNVILPEQWQVIFGAGRRLTIECISAPADSLTITGYAVVQEIG
jgi:hypothetical protein